MSVAEAKDFLDAALEALQNANPSAPAEWLAREVALLIRLALEALKNERPGKIEEKEKAQ